MKNVRIFDCDPDDIIEYANNEFTEPQDQREYLERVMKVFVATIDEGGPDDRSKSLAIEAINRLPLAKAKIGRALADMDEASITVPEVSPATDVNARANDEDKIVWTDAGTSPELDTLIVFVEMLLEAKMISVRTETGKPGPAPGVGAIIERMFCKPDLSPITAKAVSRRKNESAFKQRSTLDLQQDVVSRIQKAATTLLDRYQTELDKEKRGSR